jgi:hypothetical protein
MTTYICHALCAELPRDMREALVSWNHSADYEVPTYKDYSDHMGGGQWEKTYDLGKVLALPSFCSLKVWLVFHQISLIWLD